MSPFSPEAGPEETSSPGVEPSDPHVVGSVKGHDLSQAHLNTSRVEGELSGADHLLVLR